MSGEDEQCAWLQLGTDDEADFVSVRMEPDEPYVPVRWWQRAAAFLRPSRLLCAATGHYLCRRYWRRQPMTVRSQTMEEFMREIGSPE